MKESESRFLTLNRQEFSYLRKALEEFQRFHESASQYKRRDPWIDDIIMKMDKEMQVPGF